MKWPKQVMLIRHDTSAYNLLNDKKKENSLYQEFLKYFAKDPNGYHTQDLARRVQAMFSLRTGDARTELADKEGKQAYATGKGLSSGKIPDIIFVSPYKRTMMTLEHIKRGWPALKKVKTVEEERVREQEHGLALLYNDWRVFHALHPEQRKLEEMEGSYWYRYPQGENVPDVRARVRSFVTTLINDFAGKKVLLITHHLTILAFRAHMERLSEAQFVKIDNEDKPINCGVTVYTGKPKDGENGRLVLDRYNEKLY